MIADESTLHRMRHTHSEISFIADELNISVDEVTSYNILLFDVLTLYNGKLLYRYAVSKEFALLLQPNALFEFQSLNPSTLTEPLPSDVTRRLDTLEEGKFSTWDPKEDTSDDIK